MEPADLTRRTEQIHPTAFVAAGAVVLGDVALGAESSVWFGVVIRGDTAAIQIGSQTNIQDGSILHADAGFPCTLGNRVTVGHGAIVHGATVEDDVLIGIRAVILNGAKIGGGSLIAAGALVPEGMEIPAGSVVMGQPAKIKRSAEPRDQERISRAADHYVEYAKAYKMAEWGEGKG